jgi:flagellar assembly factor FliW
VKIQTTRFGEIHLDPSQVIRMPEGMPGFVDSKRFVMIQNKENSPFFWYQSLDDPDLAFVITDPNQFDPDFHPDFKQYLKTVSWIDLEGTFKEIACYVVVTIPKEDPQKMTGNFLGPLVMDLSSRLAVQVVMPDSGYSHKTRLLPQVSLAQSAVNR